MFAGSNHQSGTSACVAMLVGIGLFSVARAEEPFTNEALARGINYTSWINSDQFGTGIAFADLDGDLDADLIVTGTSSGVVALYENDGTGHFINRSSGSGIAFSTDISGVSFGDYDGDGDDDLHITRINSQTDRLYRNDGNFQFTDVSAAAGIDATGEGMGSTWGDYDGDGWLDLYVCNRTGQAGNFEDNHLFRNNGDGTFTDVAAVLGVDRVGDLSFLASFLDYDSDGDADLYLANDKGLQPAFMNHLFRNDGGTFTDVTVESGTEANVDCMGIAYGDIDHNGHPDLFVTGGKGHVMMMANGDGTFADESAAAGVLIPGTGWACQFFDYNNDTFEDLYLVNEGDPNVLFRNNGTFPLESVGEAMGVSSGNVTYVFATADIDQDGDLDMVVSSGLTPIRLYINQEGDSRDWVRLKVWGTGGNVHAIGAHARVTSQGLEQFREVRAGMNYKSDNERVIHVGLGDCPPAIDRIEVRWPNSTARRVLTGYSKNRTWQVWHPSRLGDPNGDGATDATELGQAIDVMIARAGSPIEPGEEIFDMNGDSVVDARDIIRMGMSFSRPSGSNAASPVPVLR